MEYGCILHHFNFTWVICEKFRSKYVNKLNSGSYSPIARAVQASTTFGCLINMGVVYKSY